SKEARNDLEGIRQYIIDTLCNPDAATRIMLMLKSGVASLSEFPERGKPLDSILSVHTEYRFLVCEKYCIFYIYNGSTVEIVRIFHQMQDYMRALFIE
ncbi:MAG: type II toxin-antitoxin system RelE/ParE family toxin, partial [Clostridia bacterium]|nr:type II toxin-antitoxin system RelE/ParE family toxin [Clostridia bacterium]